MIIRVLLAIILTFTLQVNSYGQNNIQSEIDNLIQQYLPSSSEVGIAVYNLTQNKPIYTHNSNKLSRPASTLKLITAITALSYQADPFETSLWYNGIISNNILYGDLYILGGLDPEFSETNMDQMIEELSSLDIQKITGNIYGDISLKDSLYWGEGWGWDDNPNAYQPYISPLMYNKGKVSVTVKPYGAGQKAQVSITPKSSYYTIENKTISHSPTAEKLKVSRDWLNNQNIIYVSGNVDRYRLKEINLYDSSSFFLHSFYEKAINKGIQIEGYYDKKRFIQGPETHCIYTTTTSIADVIKPMLKESDNLNAEALLIKLGNKEKAENICAKDGLNYVDSLLYKIELNPKNYQIVDGSGLSPYNLISAELLVNLLIYTHQHQSIFNIIYPSLPISGIDGTLAYRMKGTPAYKKIKAKTGTITSISSLAGYAENSKGDILAFAILNQNILKNSQAHRFQDAVCKLLCK